MTDLPADSPGQSPPTDDGWLAGPKPPGEGWTRQKFLRLLAIAVVGHVALIFLFESKRPVVSRPVTRVPHLQLTDNDNELIRLTDPTLFARPNAHDVVTAFWRQLPAIRQPNFNWTEEPRYLPPAAEDFGAAFHEFTQTNWLASFPLNFKPEPLPSLPDLAPDDALPPATTLQISGDLARRLWLNSNSIVLPSLPFNDVIAPSKVQALVDTAGNVASAVLLPSDNVLESAGRTVLSDSNALAIVRSLRFVPAPKLMFGDITVIWHTVPTNAP